MVLYPWDPITSTRVLPFNYEIPAVPANNLSVTASRGEFESASFIIRAQKDLTGIQIGVPNLHDNRGNSIPADAVDVRLVKVWYQAGEGDIRYSTPASILTPELLIKDDTLVNVDYVNTTNFLKVTLNGSQHYIDISNPAGTFPANAQVRDASSLQPFSLRANENKQIWVTVHVPDGTPAGDYYGDIIITAQSEVPEKMNFGVTVLPFDLEPAPLTYGLYYIAVLPLTDPTTLTSGSKTSNQMFMELQDMKEHGVFYPTLYQPDTAKLDTALALRDTVGFPKDSIYLGPLTPSIGNATDPAGLATIADTVITWRNHTETYGYQNTYFYGMDEVTGSILTSQRPAWQTVHANRGKMYVAGSANELIKMADILDSGVTAYALNKTQVPLWHEYGHKVLSYNNPQVGVENPEIYRRNFGFALWDAGYDGAMDYAYQHGFGQSIWNDFDAPVNRRGDHYRDHVFAYPTTDGVIDTIQWEGWREGVDDTRYLATLIKKEGSDTSARAIVSDSLAKGEDMTTIRKKVINQILITPPGK